MAYNYVFKKLIKCCCGGNYRGKMERSIATYICSNYSNYRTCTRRAVKEDKLLYYVEKYCRENKIEFIKSNYFIEDIIQEIMVDNNSASIIYKNGIKQTFELI